MCGNLTSRMRQYGWNTVTLARPSCPLSATPTSYPACSSVAAIKRQVVRLSSTTRTLARFLIVTLSFLFRTSFPHAAALGDAARIRGLLKSVLLVHHAR